MQEHWMHVVGQGQFGRAAIPQLLRASALTGDLNPFPKMTMRTCFLALMLAFNVSAPAAIKTWTNSSGGAWSAAANWTPNGAPSTGDVALISAGGTYTVSLDSSVILAGLTLGGASGTQTLATAGQQLVLNGSGEVAAPGRFLLSGNLSGTNHLLVAGQMAWVSGVVDAFSGVQVGPSGSLVIGGGAEYSKTLLGTITNSGTITYKPFGPLVLSGTLCNFPVGQFVIESPNRGIYRGQPTAVLVNRGLVQVASGGLSCDVPVVNSGTLETQVGILDLGDGCVFNDGSRFTGGGVTRLNSGINLLNGNIYSENLVFQGATLTGNASLSGAVTWGAGAIDFGAAFLLAADAQLFIGGGANYDRILRGSLTNAGTIVYAPPGPLGLAGPLHNLDSGVLDVRWDSRIYKSGPNGIFINDGTLRRSVGSIGTVCDVPLFNRGTVETQTGAFAFGDGCVFNDGSRLIGAGVTRLDSGTNLFNGNIYSENLLLQGATLAGKAALHGTITWGAGEIGDAAALLLTTNSQLFIGGGANYARTLRGTLTNAGTITYASPGPFVLAGALQNLPGGLFDVCWNSAIYRAGSAGVFINDGTLRKSAGTGGTVFEVPLLNSGTVEAQTGALVFGDASVFNAGSRFTGAGVTRLDSGTNLLRGSIYSENLLLQGATIDGAASVSGTVTWGAGDIGPGAALFIATNGQLVIGGGANYARILRGSLTNAGVIIYEPPGPLGLAGPLHNLPSGLFEIHWDYHLFSSGPDGAFINEGTCRKSAAAATTECQVPFLNRGTLDIPSGRFHFSDKYDQPSGDLVLRGGKIRSDQALTLAGGRLLGWGAVETDNLINTGATLSPSCSNGVLTVMGKYLQQIGGNLELCLGGTNPGTNLSHLAVMGAAQLSGTLTARLLPPFVPTPGDLYPVMSFISRSGDFARLNGFILLGHNLRLTKTYTPKMLSLLAVAQPDPEGVTLQIGYDGNAALVSWPLELGGGTLYACTNLAAPEWLPVPTVNNSFLDQPMSPRKSFRLSIP